MSTIPLSSLYPISDSNNHILFQEYLLNVQTLAKELKNSSAEMPHESSEEIKTKYRNALCHLKDEILEIQKEIKSGIKQHRLKLDT